MQDNQDGKVKLPRECTLFEHRNMEHAGGGWKGNHRSQYQRYLIPKAVNLYDAIAFADENSMLRDVENKRDIIQGNVYPLNMTDEKKDTDSNGSRISINVG